MRKVLTASCLALLTLASNASAEKSSGQNRTVYEFAEKSWAVGKMHLNKPLEFRDGKVLAFPTVISELTWAPKGTKPRNLMLVHEVFRDDKDKPFLADGDDIFAPVLLLPEHSYWRDNLPNTPRHEVAGGRRNVFKGSDIPEAQRVLKAYLAAYDLKGMDRWPAELRVVADALNSPVAVLSEDAVQFFADYPTLARDFPADAVPSVQAYLGGGADPERKAALVDALAEAKIIAIVPGLQELAARDDATGAMALAALDDLGSPVAADRLPSLLRAKTPAVRAWAAEALGKRAADDPAALTQATAILDDSAADPAVRAAAAAGLGAAGTPASAEVLAKALQKGDAATRPAAEALGASAAPNSAGLLAGILAKNTGEVAMAAAVGLSQKTSCTECSRALAEEYEKHPDESVRHLIGVILQVPLEHKH